MNSNVNHPSHYTQAGRKECIVEMEEEFGTLAVMIFCRLNAYKYKYRAGNKCGNSYEQDIQKANWYEEYEARLRKEYEKRGKN